MSFPKKKSRAIAIDGVTYRWMFNAGRFLAQAESFDGVPILETQLHQRLAVGYPNDDTYELEPIIAPFSNGDAKKVILTGIESGWKPITPARDHRVFKLAPAPYTRHHGPKNESVKIASSKQEAQELFDGARA